MTRKSAEPATYRVQVLERAVDILQVLSEDSRELAAGEIAERLSLHKSTIHRLLSVLDHHGLIRKNAETGKYALAGVPHHAQPGPDRRPRRDRGDPPPLGRALLSSGEHLQSPAGK
jgi:DNA-binding transcriptional ArsR family regulator